MAVPKHRRPKFRQRNTRMHIYIKAGSTRACGKCGKPVLSHTICQNCGTYRGKEMINVLARLSKRDQKTKEKELKNQEVSLEQK
ncbi:MAG: 50S ribosomal protein L32 [bacterium]|nr:50S ribosomal protein L32 [bacterium]